MTSERSPLRSQNWAISTIPGLSTADQNQLQSQGIQTTFQLLRCTQTAEQLQSLATQLNTPIRFIKKWVALADLARIPIVGCQYSGLLLHVGVLSVRQLAQMPISKLHSQILRLQVSLLQTKEQCPDLGQVSQWINQAKQL